MNTPPLTAEQVHELAEAYKRMVTIATSLVRTADMDAELRGLQDHLSKKLFEHANEFLGSWMVCHYEYQPMIDLFANVQRRMMQVHQARAKNQQQLQAQAEPEPQGDANSTPENVIKLKL